MKRLLITFLFTIFLHSSHAQECQDVSFPNDLSEFSSEWINIFENDGFPSFQFINKQDKRFTLDSLEGKLVLINYWSFGCKPCIEEMPDLNRLVEKYSANATFISVLAPGNYNIQSESLQEKLSRFDFRYQTLAMDRCFGDVFQIPFIFPTHLIIGKDGKPIDLILGANIEKLEKLIEENI